MPATATAFVFALLSVTATAQVVTFEARCEGSCTLEGSDVRFTEGTLDAYDVVTIHEGSSLCLSGAGPVSSTCDAAGEHRCEAQRDEWVSWLTCVPSLSPVAPESGGAATVLMGPGDVGTSSAATWFRARLPMHNAVVDAAPAEIQFVSNASGALVFEVWRAHDRAPVMTQALEPGARTVATAPTLFEDGRGYCWQVRSPDAERGHGSAVAQCFDIANETHRAFISEIQATVDASADDATRAVRLARAFAEEGYLQLAFEQYREALEAGADTAVRAEFTSFARAHGL